jgi:hypothetical protein
MPSWRSGSPSSRGTESRGSDDDRGHREDTVGSSQGLSPCVNRILTNTRFHKRNVRAFNLIRPARCSFLRSIRDGISRWLKSTTWLRFRGFLSPPLGGVVRNRLALRSSLSGAAFDRGRLELEKQSALTSLMVQKSSLSLLPAGCCFLCHTAARFRAGNRY